MSSNKNYETQHSHNQPPPGYPMDNNPPATAPRRKKCFPETQTKKKGDRGFIEGCLFALCCCWICDVCF